MEKISATIKVNGESKYIKIIELHVYFKKPNSIGNYCKYCECVV